jgi:hypothetical protein
MSGVRHRNKGSPVEREVVTYQQERGLVAKRIPLSRLAGGFFIGDIIVPLFGRDLIVEVKVRANGLPRTVPVSAISQGRNERRRNTVLIVHLGRSVVAHRTAHYLPLAT